MNQYKIEVMVMMPDNTWHLQTIEFQQEDAGDDAARQEALRLCKENYEDTPYVDMTIYNIQVEDAVSNLQVWAVFQDEPESSERFLVKLFSAKETATAWIDNHTKYGWDVFDIEEWQVWS